MKGIIINFMLGCMLILCLCACEQRQSSGETGNVVQETKEVMATTDNTETSAKASGDEIKTQPEVDTSLIKTVNWKVVYDDYGEDWIGNFPVFSNGTYYFQLTGGYEIGQYLLVVYNDNQHRDSMFRGVWTDLDILTADNSHLPEYYAYISETRCVEVRYFPRDHKLEIIDNEHEREDKTDYTGMYDQIYQKIAAYPEGSIIFTRSTRAFYQSVVMIPYTDGSADFIVDEKYRYHCDYYAQEQDSYYGPVRKYIYKSDDSEYEFITSAGGTYGQTFVQVTGDYPDQNAWGYYYADCTMYNG